MRKLIAPIVAGLFVIGAAHAEEDVNFEELDQDGDGQLSRTDVAQDPYLAANFTRLDSDGDGYLNQEELDGADMEGEYREAASEDDFYSEDVDSDAEAQSEDFDRVATEDEYESEDYESVSVEDDAEAEDELEEEDDDGDWK